MMAPTKDLSVEVIAKIIGLKEAGHTTKEIVDLVGVSRTSVKKYVARHRDEGAGSLPLPKKRPGRKRKTSRYAENIWGCFTGRALGELVILPKNLKVNQHNYLELLSDYLPDSFERTGAKVFQQDGAPAHTARSVTTWLEDCEVAFIKDWPGNSPDVNPIENLWALIKKDLQGHDVSSLPRLEAAIKDSWNKIPASTLENLAKSLPKRLREVKKKKGNPTKY